MKFLLLLFLNLSFIGISFSATSAWKPKYQLKKMETHLKETSKKKDEKEVKPSLSKQEQGPSIKKVSKLIPPAIKNHPLYSLYKKEYKAKDAIENLKKKTLDQKTEAVPLLTYVMKTDDFPDNNRWVATFMLGRLMGKKSANFISKFSFHPNWMLRLASLKTLLALGQDQFKGIYSRLLKDKAMIVRVQALENIRLLKLKELAPYVWAMLYDKNNYVMTQGSHKRGSIIKTIIKTMGDLEFKEARKPMLSMIQKNKYKDIHEELDYSLSKISNKPSPSGSLNIKKHYWSKLAVSEQTI